MTDEETEAVCRFLVSSSLADHLGDIRDAELRLWQILGVSRADVQEVMDDDGYSSDTVRRLALAFGLPMPDWLMADD